MAWGPPDKLEPGSPFQVQERALGCLREKCHQGGCMAVTWPHVVGASFSEVGRGTLRATQKTSNLINGSSVSCW